MENLVNESGIIIRELKNEINLDLKFYAIRSKDGKWFRAKGYNGHGDNWVDSVSKAKIYTKIGAARGQITWWANNYPQFGIPNLIELFCDKGIILDESERIKKSFAKKQREEEKWALHWVNETCKINFDPTKNDFNQDKT